MHVAGFLNLPDSFVLGTVLALLLLLTSVLQYLGHKAKRQPDIWWTPLVVLAIGAVACLGYASTVVVPNGKLAMVGNNNEPYPQGLQFKLPWEITKSYDDVIVSAPIGIYYDPDKIPMSRGISLQRDFTWSYAAEKQIDGSYLLGKACIRTFNEVIKAGQSTSYEFTCTFDGKSILVLRS